MKKSLVLLVVKMKWYNFFFVKLLKILKWLEVFLWENGNTVVVFIVSGNVFCYWSIWEVFG